MFNLISRYQSFYSRKIIYEPCIDAFKEVKGRLLDVGCGYGFTARTLAKERTDLEVYGIDRDKKRIFEAKRYKEGVNFQVADAQKIPFKDKYFSAVMSLEVLEHVDDPRKVLNEINRVLKPGGIFFLTTPLEGEPSNFYGFFYKHFNYDPHKSLYGHIQKFSLTNLKQMIRKSGFKVLETKFSAHYTSQIYDAVLQFLVRKLGQRVRVIMIPISAIVGVVSLFETLLFRSVPIGLDVQIICRKLQ